VNIRTGAEAPLPALVSIDGWPGESLSFQKVHAQSGVVCAVRW